MAMVDTGRIKAFSFSSVMVMWEGGLWPVAVENLDWISSVPGGALHLSQDESHKGTSADRVSGKTAMAWLGVCSCGVPHPSQTLKGTGLMWSVGGWAWVRWN